MANLLIKKNNIDLSVNSKIKEITIYSNKAIISRHKKVKLNKGENTIYFNNLGMNIEEQSIKASLDLKNAIWLCPRAFLRREEVVRLRIPSL